MNRYLIKYYNDHAHILYTRDRALPFEQLHQRWLRHLPAAPGLALDVGAGSGRDADALAARGWEVYALEPAPERRALAQQHSPTHVRWLDDALPGLETLARLELAASFDLILVSAVWMHVAPSDRDRAFRKLVHHLKPGGVLVFTLRHGPAPHQRSDHPTSPEELTALASRFAVEPLHSDLRPRADLLSRPEVTWQTVALRAPNDDSGGLATVRHIILNDLKSSTYKLALLRALVRIADGAAGAVLQRDDAHVHLPLGLVALTWTRLFHPLIQQGMRQQPAGNGALSFARDPFLQLIQQLPVNDLQLGRCFAGAQAETLDSVLRSVRNTLRTMPVRYTTRADGTPIFRATTARRLRADTLRLDLHSLATFGTFSVPLDLWSTLRRYACWIEPAINLEWARLMATYDAPQPRPLGDYLAALEWPEHERDTREVRDLIARLRTHVALPCVWSGRPLPEAYEVDHCLPFARWPNNDLWNLLPASVQSNADKRDRLPSARLLDQARDRILAFWQLGAAHHPSYAARFIAQAQASLPCPRDPAGALDLELVFEGLCLQRWRLRHDQQLLEWTG